MSDAYENVIGGKLKLKGKPLDVKAGGVSKRKKKKTDRRRSDSDSGADAAAAAAASSEGKELVAAAVEGGGGEEAEEEEYEQEEEGGPGRWDSKLTAAERRYVEQRARIDSQRLAKTADKSHRDRIEDFNQYLANMSEHYDIPKVGPG